MELINVYDYENAARERLAQQAWDYYSSGAHDEITLRENHAAYDRITLRYRVLRDVSKVDLSATVLDHTVSMPVLIAPTAFQRMAHPDGEVATVAAVVSVTLLKDVPISVNLYRSYEDEASFDVLLEEQRSYMERLMRLNEQLEGSTAPRSDPSGIDG